MLWAVRTSAATLSPYSGTPASIPGQIAAANFDNGGEGVAYHDTTPGNTGGAYRATDVDLEASSEGGYDIGWIAAGEWVNYSVNVAASGAYIAQLRVASPSGGSLHIGFNGPSAGTWKTVSIPATGGWQNWTTVNVPVTLGAGVQQMTLLFDTNGFNVRYVNVAGSGSGPVSSTGSTPTPYNDTRAAIPGRVEAENFDNGGEGVAYHDTTGGNTGGAYRATDVDIEPSSEGGYDVGWIAAGEWLNYSVSVATTGNYTAQLRVASPSGGSLHIGFNGPSAGTWKAVSIPATGGWQNWTTVNVPLTLGAGAQLMTLSVDTNGFNIDYVDVSSSSSTSSSLGSGGGSTVTVPQGANLQSYLDAAQPGDTLLLLPGVTYVGTYTLAAKPGASYITITSAAPAANLPGDGVRMGPQYAAQLAKIQGGYAGAPAFVTAPGAHHWRLQWLEIVSSYTENNIIELGDASSAQNSLSQVPHDLIVDRCYIHGDPTNGQKRGIALNSASTSIVNSYISDIKSAQEDSQAIAGWNGPGPYTIENNYLEAAGENFLLGGADPYIQNLVPSDISFRFNHVAKQPSWRGQSWTVKNLMELKNAQRVVVDQNLFEYNWAAAQSGYAFMLTPRQQGELGRVRSTCSHAGRQQPRVRSQHGLHGRNLRRLRRCDHGDGIRVHEQHHPGQRVGGDGRKPGRGFEHVERVLSWRGVSEECDCCRQQRVLSARQLLPAGLVVGRIRRSRFRQLQPVAVESIQERRNRRDRHRLSGRGSQALTGGGQSCSSFVQMVLNETSSTRRARRAVGKSN
jgi:hypothetical protein